MSSSWDFNWQRISRGCVLAAFVMTCWLLLPVAQCSWGAWNATPISAEDPAASALGQADKDRLTQGHGFFEKLGTAVEGCYAKTPFFGQEPWKNNLLYAFAGAAVVAYGLAKLQARRNKSYVR